MEGRIIELNDFPFGEYRLGNPNLLAKTKSNALGQGRLTITRSAIQEKPGARIDCGAKPGKHLGIHRNIAKRMFQLLSLGGLSRDGLGVDGGDIVRQCDWSRSRVGASIEQMFGQLPALI